MRVRALLVALGVAATTVIGASSSSAAGCDRACRIEAANRYLAALVSHDGADVPLAEDAWRQENGGNTLHGGENIRAALSHPIMYVITGIHDLRWTVDGDQVVSEYHLDTVAPTYIVERFRVDDAGLITEIDAHFYIDTTGHLQGPESAASNPEGRRRALLESNHGPLGPVPVHEGNTGDDAERPPSSCDRACVEAAATAYLDAVATGDASAVPLAGAVVQTINHRPITDVAAELAAGAVTIAAVEDRIVAVDGNEAVVLHHTELIDGSRLYAATRLTVVDGLITEIHAVCDGAELCR